MTTSRRSKQTPARENAIALGRRSLGSWKRLAAYFRASRGRLVWLALISVVAGFTEASLLALVASIALVMASNGVNTEVQLGPFTIDVDLNLAFGVAVGLVVLRTGLQLLMAYIPAALSAGAIADLRRALFDAYVDAEWARKSKEREGVLQALMSTHVNGTSQALLYLGAGLSALFMFITMLVSALILSPYTALVIMAASLLLFLALRPLSRRLRSTARRLSDESKTYAVEVQEVNALAEETQVFGASTTYRSNFHDVIEAVRKPALQSRFMSQSVPALYQSIALLMLVLALAVVAFVSQSDLASLGAIVLVLVRALTYAQQVQGAISSLDEKAPFMDELADAIEGYREAAEDPGEEPVDRIDSLEVRDVRFSYDGVEDVLHGVSLGLKRGQAMGIVGPSGAGKSSLVQVLLRLRNPSAGEFLANGVPARHLSRSDWRRLVAYVPQFPQLISGSVADNIRFFRPDLADEDIVRAARRAHIHDEIMGLPNQYRTIIGQKVSAVSGGQRQRICLARALAADPDVLILDEPTSALDLVSERAVQTSLEELRQEKIVLLVAHRVSTLAICDKIVVLVGGRVDASGSPSEVENDSGFFGRISAISRGGEDVGPSVDAVVDTQPPIRRTG